MRNNTLARILILAILFAFISNSSCAPDSHKKGQAVKRSGGGGGGGGAGGAAGAGGASGAAQDRAVSKISHQAGTCDTKTYDTGGVPSKLKKQSDDQAFSADPVRVEDLPPGIYWLTSITTSFDVENLSPNPKSPTKDTEDATRFTAYNELGVAVEALGPKPQVTETCKTRIVGGMLPERYQDAGRDIGIDSTFTVDGPGKIKEARMAWLRHNAGTSATPPDVRLVNDKEVRNPQFTSGIVTPLIGKQQDGLGQYVNVLDSNKGRTQSPNTIVVGRRATGSADAKKEFDTEYQITIDFDEQAPLNPRRRIILVYKATATGPAVNAAAQPTVVPRPAPRAPVKAPPAQAQPAVPVPATEGDSRNAAPPPARAAVAPAAAPAPAAQAREVTPAPGPAPAPAPVSAQPKSQSSGPQDGFVATEGTNCVACKMEGGGDGVKLKDGSCGMALPPIKAGTCPGTSDGNSAQSGINDPADPA